MTLVNSWVTKVRQLSDALPTDRLIGHLTQLSLHGSGRGSKQIKTLAKDLRTNVADEDLVPQIAVAFNPYVSTYRHIRDQLVNIAEAVADTT